MVGVGAGGGGGGCGNPWCLKVDVLHTLNLADVVPSAHQMECVAHKYSHVDAVFREHGEIRADGSLNLLNENG